MIRRIAALAAVTIVSAAALTSCGGRNVRLEGDNEVEGSTAPVTEQKTEPPTTEAETEPATEPGPPVRVEVDVKMPEGYKLKNKASVYVEAVLQEPELPTGCEITALTELLGFYGFSANKSQMADIFMPNDPDGYYTMNDAYLGNPHLDNGFGCNAPVIVRTANDLFDYIKSDWYAVDLTGSPIEEIYYQIEQGRPAIVWTTIRQVEIAKEYQFRLGCGEDFWFNGMQHCVVLYGYDYDEKKVSVADPLAGDQKYDMERFERIYASMDKQAVILIGNEESAGVEYATNAEKSAWMKANRVFEGDSRVWLRKNYTEKSPEEPAVAPVTESNTEA